MMNPHIRLTGLSLLLILASLFVPEIANTKEEYRVMSLGYPLAFVEQNNTGYLGVSEMYPRRYLFSSPHNIPTDFMLDRFLLSWFITSCVLEFLWLVSKKFPLKNTRLIFIVLIVGVSIASVIIINIYEERREQQREVQRQAQLTVITNDALGISTRYDENLLKLESNTEPSLHFSSPLGRIDIQETPSTNSFLELSSPADSNPLQGFMMLERFDQQGLTGYKRWDLATQSSDAPSRITYRFHRGDSLLEITTTLDALDPMSADSQTLEKASDELVRHITFADETDTANRIIPKTWAASLDLDLMLDAIPLNTEMNYGPVMKGKTDPESTTVTNADLGIGLAYNPAIFSVRENAGATELGTPTLELQSDFLRVTFQEATLEEFASIQQPQLRSPVPLERVMLIARYDRAGFTGYRQWDWIVQNEAPISHIIYRFHRGNNVLEIKGWIEETDPRSERFREAEAQLELLVENMWFEGHDEKTRGVIQKDLFPAVSENLIFP